MSLFIGLMSGTSADGIDAVLVDLDLRPPAVLASYVHRLPQSLRTEIVAVASGTSLEDLSRFPDLDVRMGHLFADAALELLAQAGLHPSRVRAIGSHGQTLRHAPEGNTPYSIQIGDPNVIAERTGITTVADFRRRDMAAGGQGAPLAPAFHRAAFQSSDAWRAIVNIGGIANVTILPPGNAADPGASREVRGFDTGPGNALMDSWIAEHLRADMDVGGQWAQQGAVLSDLLTEMLRDPWLRTPPPKSTGREHFNRAWIEKHLASFHSPLEAQDVQRTLCELTIVTIGNAVTHDAHQAGDLLVCGGGAHNRLLMHGLQKHLSEVHVASTSALGVDPDWVEAMAFAWLARETLAGRPGNIPSVTGARHPVVLGGIYPANNAEKR